MDAFFDAQFGEALEASVIFLRATDRPNELIPRSHEHLDRRPQNRRGVSATRLEYRHGREEEEARDGSPCTPPRTRSTSPTIWASKAICWARCLRPGCFIRA